MTSSEKYKKLLQEIGQVNSLIVAFSGGVDSSLLLYAAARALGREKVLAVTALAQTYPAREREEAAAFCAAFALEHQLITSNEVGEINARGNPADRCFYCKSELFGRLKALARERGFAAVAEGSNVDDDHDYRPGRRAIRELGILSPLKAVGLDKSEIRLISRELGLPSWDKPACACLVSRFPYHVELTEEALGRIEKAEDFIRSIGFRQCRVRHYGEKARVEVDKERVAEALRREAEIVNFLSSLGYVRIEIDPLGYRTGSMNVF